jgi:hypothetical protein
MTEISRDEYERRLSIWLAALRDPTRKQAQGRLRFTSGAMCCLGVACDVSGQGSWNTDLVYITERNQSWISLPGEVKNYYGMLSCGGVFAGVFIVEEKDKRAQSIMQLNDRLEWTFPQIADFIETHKKWLFHWAI